MAGVVFTFLTFLALTRIMTMRITNRQTLSDNESEEKMTEYEVTDKLDNTYSVEADQIKIEDGFFNFYAGEIRVASFHQPASVIID